MKEFDDWWNWQNYFQHNDIVCYNACRSAWEMAQKQILDMPKSPFLNTAYMKRDQEAIKKATENAIKRYRSKANSRTSPTLPD